MSKRIVSLAALILVVLAISSPALGATRDSAGCRIAPPPEGAQASRPAAVPARRPQPVRATDAEDCPGQAADAFAACWPTGGLGFCTGVAAGVLASCLGQELNKTAQ